MSASGSILEIEGYLDIREGTGDFQMSHIVFLPQLCHAPKQRAAPLASLSLEGHNSPRPVTLLVFQPLIKCPA